MKKLLSIWILFFTMFTTVMYADITTGLEAHYEFEGNINDSSGNNRNLSVNSGGTSSYIAGKLGSAYSLNGSNNYLSSLTALTAQNAGTVAFWVNGTSPQDLFDTIVATYGTTKNAGVYTNGDFSQLSIGDGQAGYDTFPADLNNSNWHHIVMTFDGTTNSSKTYFDGTLQSGTHNSENPGLGENIYIGWGGIANAFIGSVDDVRIYNRTLTATDITELYADAQPKLTLKAHGGAVQFSPTGSMTSLSNFAFASHAVEFWVQTKSIQNQQLVQLPVNANTYSQISMLADGKVYVKISADVTNYRDIFSASVINDGAWHHIAYDYNATANTSALYIDGLLESSITDTGFTTGLGSVTAILKINGVNQADMLLDEVRIWNTPRTQAEIKASMNHQLDGNETGLVAYYNFDERIGTTVIDIAGHDNNATIEGNVTRVNFLGDGLDFSASNAVVNVGDVLNGAAESTMAAWVKFNNNYDGSSDVITLKEGVGSMQIIAYKLYWDDGTNTCTGGIHTLEKNRWYHVVTTYNDSLNEVKLYVDGVLDRSCENNSSMNTTANPRTIGNFNNGYNFNGNIAELSLWNRALNQAEIQKLMNAMPNVNDANLTGYWPLNEGGGSIAYDHSSIPHNGTITAATWTNTAPTIYGNNIYTSSGITVLNKLVVENNTSIPTYIYNGSLPSTILDFNGTIGVFTYSSLIAATQFLDINANDGGVNLNSLFKATVYPTIYLNINIPSLNLNDFNITSIRAYTPDSAIEDLFVYDYYGRGGSNSITNGVDNNYSVPIYFPNNNFAIEVNGTFFNGQPQPTSWYYNFNDGKLYPDINSTTDFKTEINATNNTFTISTSNREYYTFTGNLFENDNNVTNIVLISNDIGLGYHGIVAQGATSYSVMYSELGAHTVFLFVDGNTSTPWYYNFVTGDINSTYQSTPSTIDTSTVKSFDLNLSSAHFADYSSVAGGTIPPTISHVYDYFRTPFQYSEMNYLIIPFDINDTDSLTLTLSVTADNNNTLNTASFPVNSSLAANQTQSINIIPVSATSVGDTRVTITLSDGNTTVQQIFNVKLSHEFEIIATKEANISGISFNADYNGTLYALSSHLEENNLTVEYEKLKVTNSIFDSNLTTIKDINGTVTLTTKTNTVPAPFQYASSNLGSMDLSNAYSAYGTPFAFTEGVFGTKVYVTYPSERLESYASDMRDQNSSFFTSINSFMSATVQGITTLGIRNHARNKLLVFNQNEVANSNGTLIELGENGTVLTANAGTWIKQTVSSQEVLLIYPTTALATASGYDTDIAFVLDGGIVKSASYKASGDIYSYILLNKAAKDEIYYSLSPNPKIATPLNSGYTYISLPSSETLCDENTTGNSLVNCDQSNTLESVFGVNSTIDLVFKFGREWMYWDNNSTVNPAYSMQKFSTINPLEGIMVKTSAATTVNMPFDEDSEIVNDYTNMFSTGWTLMSNNKAQTVGEISASLTAEGKELVYILVLRGNTWYVYAPTNNSAVSSSIPRLNSVNRYESYWVYFIPNALLGV
ncbi:MAG: LamG domain-containing protein [Sulfurimonas sp.]|jgi:hypothetical protein